MVMVTPIAHMVTDTRIVLIVLMVLMDMVTAMEHIIPITTTMSGKTL